MTCNTPGLSVVCGDTAEFLIMPLGPSQDSSVTSLTDVSSFVNFMFPPPRTEHHSTITPRPSHGSVKRAPLSPAQQPFQDPPLGKLLRRLRGPSNVTSRGTLSPGAPTAPPGSYLRVSLCKTENPGPHSLPSACEQVQGEPDSLYAPQRARGPARQSLQGVWRMGISETIGTPMESSLSTMSGVTGARTGDDDS